MDSPPKSKYFNRQLGRPRRRELKLDERGNPLKPNLTELHVWFEQRSREWHGQEFDWKDELEVLDRLPERGLTVILGEPGSGKTALARHWARTLAQRLLHPAKKPSLTPMRQPLYTRCGAFRSHFAQNIAGTAKNVLEYAGLNTPVPSLEHSSAKRVYIFDALDELPREARETFAQSLAALQGHIVLTCRTAIWANELRTYFTTTGLNPQELELRGLTPKDQLEFLSLRALPPGVTALSLSDSLQKSQQLRGLAANALMLELMAEVGYPLPASRARFYQDATNKMWQAKLKDQKLEGHSSSPSSTHLDALAEGHHPFLSTLSFQLAKGDRPATLFSYGAMHKAAKSLGWKKAEEEEMVEALLKCGLLVKEESSEYSFRHPTFQEYFLAEALLSPRPGETLEACVERILLERWSNPDLLETLGLMLAIANDRGSGVLAPVRALIRVGTRWTRKDLASAKRSPIRTALHVMNLSGCTLQQHEAEVILGDLKKHPIGLPLFLRAFIPVKDRLVRLAIASDSNSPGDLLLNLASNWDRDVRFRVAANPNTPPEELLKLARSPEEVVRQVVAANPNTPPEELLKLASDSDKYVGFRVAANPNTPTEELLKLTSDSHEYLRRGVAANSNTSPGTLLKLASDSDRNVRLEVAANPNTPPEVLMKLASDSDVDVRFSVAGRLKIPPEVLMKLASDSDKSVRLILGANKNVSPEELRELGFYSDEYVRLAVATSPNTPPEMLLKLARDSDLDVRLAVTHNPNTVIEALLGRD